MSKRAKRLLFLGHRWLGIIMCAFFAMWFVSGVVMMYVGYPKLTEAERLQHLPPLNPAASMLAPAVALERAGVTAPLTELRLAAGSGGQPVYFANAEKSPTVVIDAGTGKRISSIDERHALASAAAFAGPGAGLRYLGVIDEDAFTHSRGLDLHRPLHKVETDDDARTLLYISGQTGEVVRDAPFGERLWNYAGAWLHWLYPLRGNAFDRYWTDIVNWLSIVGIVVAMAGTVVGIMRWRFFRPYRSGARTPYPGAMMRWHHISGLLFALVTITWIFSGLMSMNPWKVFDTGAPPLRTTALNGGALTLSDSDASPKDLLLAAGANIRELRWIRSLGSKLVLAQAAGGRPFVLDSEKAQLAAVERAALLANLPRLVDANPAKVDELKEYDLYYYARDAHAMTGGRAKPLPVLRVVFDDPYATWVHIDPHTGIVVNRLDSGKRASRWLFAMLHSWDWIVLLERRPLWDVLLILLSLGGTLLSATGAVVGWRRLGRKLAATF